MSNVNNKNINDADKVGIGSVLKLLRIAKEMTPKELAIKMDVSPSYICEVEANKKNPSFEMLSKYSEALGVKRSTILYFDERREQKGYHYQKLLFEILQKIIDVDEE